MRQITTAMLLGAALAIAAPVQAQNQASPPEGFRVIGNIYWVGGEYGSYLITTPQGHILHDTGTSEMHDVIVANVKKVGFDVRDIKMIVSSHAHFDHVQGHAAMCQGIRRGPPCGVPPSQKAERAFRLHSAAVKFRTRGFNSSAIPGTPR
jgi:glyoxylase-like metal-dependent hydrolase (beta-lactamase superfamily II)